MHNAFLRCIWRYRLVFAVLLSHHPIISSSAQAHALQDKSVTIRIKNASLGDILKKVSKNTGVRIYFLSNELNAFTGISLNVQKMPFKSVLHELLDNRGLTWVEVNKTTITVKKNEESSKTNLAIFIDSTINVSGRIINQKGEPVIGATILVKGSQQGVYTSTTGSFLLKSIAPNSYVVISNIGYLTREIHIKGKSQLGDIQLEQNISKLDETIVIAYGTTSQRMSTGNVTTIKAVDIEKQPISNPLLALQGRVPGLFITESTGYANSGVTVRIQGQNSIRMGNDPLYVVDGVPFRSQNLTTVNGITGSSGNSSLENGIALYGNPLSYINPNDIESIDVLKDADATAIYGSRAANGAILITTKKGKAGRFDVDVNYQTGWGHVSTKIDMMNTPQYLEMRREGFKNDNLTPNSDKDYDLFSRFGWSQQRSTNWQNELIGGTARYTNVQASISGGKENIQFIVGGAYKKQGTVIPGEFSDVKGSFHSNISASSNNRKLNMSLSTNYMRDFNQLPSADIAQYAYILPPNAPAIYNSDGSLNWAVNDAGVTTWGIGNPVLDLLRRYKANTNNLVTNLSVSYQLLRGLEIRASGGYTETQLSTSTIFPRSSFPPDIRDFVERFTIFETNSGKSWIVEPQIKYKSNFNGLGIEVLAGGTIQRNSSRVLQLQGAGYATDDVMEELSTSTSISLVSATNTNYKYDAIFGRVNLNWREKYILNLTGRRDGSSRFGYENMLHNFGSIGAAWIFSNEVFFQNTVSVISFGKVRGSYGTTGSDQIGDYKFLNLYGPVPASLPYLGTVGNLPLSIANPYLQWEETKKLQFGLDLGFFSDRLIFAANYFRNKSDNQLLAYALPYTAGFPSISSNFPAILQNTGWELSLSSVNIKSKRLTWNTSVNITIPKNKLVSFPNLASSSYTATLVVGESANVKRVFKYAGVDATTGVYQFVDAKGQITSNPSDPGDKIVTLNTDPKFYGGLQNTVEYRGFSLDVLFQFVKQNGPNYRFGGLPGYFEGISGNQPTSVLERWQKAGDVRPVQKYSSTLDIRSQQGYAAFSDVSVADASFIRLKNLSLSYNVPDVWTMKAHIKDVKLYIQGQNVLTFTSYKGADPENRTTYNLPPLRMLTAGIKATF